MAVHQKNPISRSLPLYIDRAIRNAIEAQGRALPGYVVAVNGAIVTVNFEVPGITLPGNVQLPLAGAEYIRYPIQPKSENYSGDKGVCFPVDAYIGSTSGLGSVTQTNTAQGNLSNLVWFPIGNKDWSEVDPNAVTIYGPNGVVLRDTDSNTVSTLTPNGVSTVAKTLYTFSVGSSSFTMNSNSIMMTAGGHTLTIDSSGIIFDGIVFTAHIHTAVQAGTQLSGPVDT